LQYSTLGSRSQRGYGASGRSKIEGESGSEKGKRASISATPLSLVATFNTEKKV